MTIMSARLYAVLLLSSLMGCVATGEKIPEQTLNFTPRPIFQPGSVASSMSVGGERSRRLAEQSIPSQKFDGLIQTTSQQQVSDLPVTLANASSTAGETGGHVLNFENANVRDVVKAVLNDTLGINYTIDPAVQGAITLRTSKPLSRQAVLPAFEDALRLAGVALVRGAVGYQVVPLQGAAQRGAIGVSGDALQPGFQLRVVPLRYIASAEAKRVLEPLVSPSTIVSVDRHSNFVLLAGTGTEIDRAERAIELFDVNWLRSRSFGLFPLRYSSAKDVAEDLGSVLGKEGPLAGTVQVTPIAHLNAILVIAKSALYIEDMRGWIERFDRGRDADKPRLFIYHVQNGRARDLATVLAKVMGPLQRRATPASADETVSIAELQGLGAAGSLAPPGRLGVGLGLDRFVPPPQANGPSGVQSSETASSGGDGDTKITADETNNSLLIITTPEYYKQLEAALIRLDAAPLQVMLEASIAEVSLTDKTQYGIQAFFQQGGVSFLRSGVAASALAAGTGGLSAAFIKGLDIKAVLDLLSSFTKVRVISAPKLLVLNNRTASLQVGDQVPIATSSAVSSISANAPTVNTIQLQDTGIILRVTPRVNSNGLVLMDISQEVSTSVPTNTSNINSPTIQQRRVATSIAVQDGQTVAIGGLMKDSRGSGRTGIPILKDLPGVGAAFGVENDGVDRIELLVLMTPRVIRDVNGADAATEELRAKLPLIRANYAPAAVAK